MPKAVVRNRNVAQSGRAPVWGTGGREIEARRSDHSTLLGSRVGSRHLTVNQKGEIPRRWFESNPSSHLHGESATPCAAYTTAGLLVGGSADRNSRQFNVYV